MAGQPILPCAEAGGRVLVVDPDFGSLATIARALRERGHEVTLAADGRAGLQQAVDMAAEVVLVDRAVPVVDVRTFIEVIRDNPRTASADLFVMGDSERAALGFSRSDAHTIVKPFNADEVASRVNEVLVRRHQTQHEPELRGELEQVAIFDLIQMFKTNRRTGKLSIGDESRRAEVWIDEGDLVDASWGQTRGEKALYRVLAEGAGSFVFVPGLKTADRRIESSVDLLLMEGARRGDEVRRQWTLLPAPRTLVESARRESTAQQEGLARDLMVLLEEPRTLAELIDMTDAFDLETLRTVAALMQQGLVVKAQGEDLAARICESEEDEIVLRAETSHLRRPGVEGSARLGVILSTQSDAARWASALRRVEEFVPSSTAPQATAQGVLGPLGEVRLKGARIELFALPYEVALRPLWATVLAPSTVVLMLGSTPEDSAAQRLLESLQVQTVQVESDWCSPSGAASALRKALSSHSA